MYNKSKTLFSYVEHLSKDVYDNFSTVESNWNKIVLETLGTNAKASIIKYNNDRSNCRFLVEFQYRAYSAENMETILPKMVRLCILDAEIESKSDTRDMLYKKIRDFFD